VSEPSCYETCPSSPTSFANFDGGAFSFNVQTAEQPMNAQKV
jgi:hypothetical protein